MKEQASQSDSRIDTREGEMKKNYIQTQEKEEGHSSGASAKYPIVVLISRLIARHPWKAFAGAIVCASAISVIGIVTGEFYNIEADNEGWSSRGTLISKRAIQTNLLLMNETFINTAGGIRQQLSKVISYDNEDEVNHRTLLEQKSSDRISLVVESSPRPTTTQRVVESQNKTTTCDLAWYDSNEMIYDNNLIAVWKSSPIVIDDEESDHDQYDRDQTDILSALDPQVLSEICEAETKTLSFLEDQRLCFGCDDGKCLPPYSLIYLLKLFLGITEEADLLEVTCDDLLKKYTPSIQTLFESSLIQCTEGYAQVTEISNDVTCPLLQFKSNIVSNDFSKDNIVLRYTSSIYPTSGYSEDIYDNIEGLDQGDGIFVSAVYDTREASFEKTAIDELTTSDMFLLMASSGMTFTAMLIHTKSIWLTLIGIIQIAFSIPLAFFFYTVLVRLEFFPFLNFCGFFVVAALGADDVFVAVDKWKNTRLQFPNASTEDIAAIAFPDAAKAMLLTTITTSVAFFATAICRVIPVRCFAIFCGLLIIFDYLMDIAVMFPALCLYDKWIVNGQSNYLITFGKTQKIMPAKIDIGDGLKIKAIEASTTEEKESLICRALHFYFHLMHKFRWPLIVISMIALGLCTFVATLFQLPESSEVRLLPGTNQFELHDVWGKHLLSKSLGGESSVDIIWGLLATDNGNHNNPRSVPSLALDNTFDPSKSPESQLYLLDFCDRLFKNDFAIKPQNYSCPINSFDEWLQEQHQLSSNSSAGSNNNSNAVNPAYLTYCNNVSSIPLSEDTFDQCFITWSKSVNDNHLIHDDREILAMRITSFVDVTWLSHLSDVGSRWNDYERFLDKERSNAPDGVNNFFHSSVTFWFYDTSMEMYKTALGAAAITVSFSFTAVLISSRSFVLTLFSGAAIFYVLVSTTATLVGLGWDLGYLEAICFTILLGLSCDFVIHFSHAYSSGKEAKSSRERAKHMLIHMGPSILAAAVTTVSAALISKFIQKTYMYECKISYLLIIILFLFWYTCMYAICLISHGVKVFMCQLKVFKLFAMILLMTIIHAIIASFVIFLLLAIIFGPSEPTKCMNNLFQRCFSTNDEEEGKCNSIVHSTV